MLDNFFRIYVHHCEAKFENGEDTGTMRRRRITRAEPRYIGKEVKNIDAIEIEPPTEYVPKKEIKRRIIEMSAEERKRLGWSRQKLYYLRKKINP